MPGELEEQLGLDIAPALQAIAEIDDAFQRVIQDFQVGLADALNSLTAGTITVGDQVDTSPLETAVTGAIEDAGATPVTVEGDASELDAAVADALDAPRPPIEVDGDTAPLASALDAETGQPRTVEIEGDTGPMATAIDGAASEGATVPVDADTTAAQSAIDALGGETIPVEVDADTTAAQDQLDQLGQSATEAVGTKGGGEGLAGLEGAVGGFEAAAATARGEGAALNTTIAGFGPSAAVGVAGGVAFVGFLKETVSNAADAQAQTERFRGTFGPLSEAIRQVHVGGLNTDIETLGRESGTTVADLEAAASRVGALGKSAQASNPQVKETVGNILALAGTLSVSNPRLGTAADVANGLNRALVTGGRFAANFGLALQAADIKTRAQEIAGAGNEVSRFDLLTAGAQLAVESFGGSLGKKFAEGADNAQVKLRAFRTEIEETLVKVGLPLLAPVVASFEELTPVVEALGRVLGSLAKDILPSVAAAGLLLRPLAGVFTAIADGLGFIGPAGGAALVGVTALSIFLNSSLVPSFISSTVAASGLSIALDAALSPTGIGVILGGLAILGGALHLFGGSEDEVKQTTEDMGDALFGQVDSVEALDKAVRSLSTNLDKFLTSQDGLAKDAPAVNSALRTTGENTEELKKAIEGTGKEFDDFKGKLASQGPAFDAVIKKYGDLSQAQIANLQAQGQVTFAERAALQTHQDVEDELGNLRDAYRNSINGQLEFLVVQGSVTQEQINSFRAQETLKDGTIDYAAVLRDATGAAKEHEDALSHQAAAADKNQTALAQLREEIIAGTISSDDAKQRLADMGIKAAGDIKPFTDLADAVKSFRDKVTSGLPDAAAALDTYTKTVTDDFQKVLDAQKDHNKGLAEAQRALTEATSPDAFIANMRAEIKNIQDFQHNLAIIAQTSPELAGFLAEQGIAAGSGLAAGLVSDRSKIKTTEAVRELLDRVRGAAIEGDVQTEFHQAGVAHGQAYTSGVKEGLSGAPTAARVEFTKTLAELSAEERFRAAAGDTAGAASTGWKRRFLLANEAESEVAKIVPAITNHTAPTKTAAQKLAQSTNEAFGGSLTPAQQVDPAFQKAADAIKVETAVGTESHTLGFRAGTQFVIGLATSIEISSGPGGGLETAGIHAAQAVERGARSPAGFNATSPSKKGIALGLDFGQGVVIGIQQSEADAETAAASFANTVSGAAKFTVNPSLNLAPNVQSTVSTLSTASQTDALVAALEKLSSSKTGVLRTAPLIGQNVFNEKVDPLHVAREIAWQIR